MIKKLIVKDFAIIEDLTLEFQDKMTVLTGETGAGKSLIIDTISLLLGARADSDMIRYGKSKATVEGVFTPNSNLEELFKTLDIKVSDEIDIYREITETRNIIKVNGVNVTLTSLKSIAKMLADIHVQNDTYRLFNPDEYLSLIDPKEDKTFDKLLLNYSKSLMTYNEAYSLYDKIKKNQKSELDRLDFMKYEKEELEGLNLSEDIDIELNDTVSRLSNFDKISNALNTAYSSLENEYSPLDQIYEAAKALEDASDYDASLKDMSSKLLDTYYISSDVKDNIAKEIGNLDYDEDELNNAIERLNDIDKAKEKYKKSVNELIKYLADITLQIEMVENYDEVLKDADTKLKKAYEKLVTDAVKLSDYRKKLAKNLESGIVKECKDLDLESTRFNVAFQEVLLNNPYDKSCFKENGIDTIDLMVSFNDGEPLRSLSKVASGGEASRMMLAFKSYFSSTSGISLQVFDEIDTGVSGKTAGKIALKMKKISEKMQVLCITHLPQVAASGNHHIYIYKTTENKRTFTQIKKLEGEERVEEIAKMLSGDTVSVYALEHAKELIEKYKN